MFNLRPVSNVFLWLSVKCLFPRTCTLIHFFLFKLKQNIYFYAHHFIGIWNVVKNVWKVKFFFPIDEKCKMYQIGQMYLLVHFKSNLFLFVLNLYLNFIFIIVYTYIICVFIVYIKIYNVTPWKKLSSVYFKCIWSVKSLKWLPR